MKLTRKPASVTKDDIQTLKQHGISDRGILDINMITSYFNFVNRIAQGLGVEFSRDEIEGYNY